MNNKNTHFRNNVVSVGFGVPGSLILEVEETTAGSIKSFPSEIFAFPL
jgi:hypothetical protein